MNTRKTTRDVIEMLLTLATAILLGLMLVQLLGCGTLNVGLVPPEKMQPKELAVYSMSVYNQQYDDYLAKATLPDLSDAEKKILRIKKRSLVDSWPIIKTYSYYVDHGQVPPEGIQQEILEWLNSVRY